MNNRKRKWYPAFIACLIPLLLPGCFSYNMELRSFSSMLFKDKYKDFTFHTKPVPRYELGMLFHPAISENLSEIKTGKTMKLPSTPEEWLKDSLSETTKAEVLKRVINETTVKGINTPFVITDNIDLEIVVPGLKELMALFKVENFRTGTHITVSADRLVTRKLVWKEILKAIKNGHIKKDIADTIMRKEYVVAAEELVVYGYRVLVAVSRQTNPELVFALEDAFERHMEPKSIYFELSAVKPNVFAIEEPVSIGALWKKRPDRNNPEKIHPPPLFEDIKTWESVQVPLNTLYALESRGPEKNEEARLTP